MTGRDRAPDHVMDWLNSTFGVLSAAPAWLWWPLAIAMLIAPLHLGWRLWPFTGVTTLVLWLTGAPTWVWCVALPPLLFFGRPSRGLSAERQNGIDPVGLPRVETVIEIRGGHKVLRGPGAVIFQNGDDAARQGQLCDHGCWPCLSKLMTNWAYSGSLAQNVAGSSYSCWMPIDRTSLA